MPINIEIKDAHAQLLVDFYIQRLKILHEEIQNKEIEIKEITSTIQKLKKKELKTTPSSATIDTIENVAPYSNKWPWVKKIHFVLGQVDRPMTTKEIVEALTEFEPTFMFERKKVVASISSILSSKSGDDKEFVKVESESGDFAYYINRSTDEEEDVTSLPF